MNEYEKQARNFLKKYNAEITIEYLKTDYHFQGDKEKRDIYKITIMRGVNYYSFNYGDSIYNSMKKKRENPGNYDILACLPKYDVGDFDDFIFEYGYEFKTEKEYIKLKQLYFDIKDEYNNIYNLFSDCIEELQEIC